ncbi:MAG TPA: hypothetical protein VF484_10465 [Candidatus Limnocylindrales bacterium]
MAAEGGSIATTHAPATASERELYAPAWPHYIVRPIHDLPVPSLLIYVAIAVAGLPLLEVRYWSIGQLPVGALDTNSLTYAIALATILYLFGSMERSAYAAFDRFRPALRPGADAAAIRQSLAVLPAPIGGYAFAASVALTAFRYAFDPASSDVQGLPTWAAACAFVFEALNVGVLFCFVAQLFRQTRTLRRVLAEDTVVDIYRPGPLHALSGLSARMGIGLVLLTGAIAVLVSPSDPGSAVDVLSLLPFVALPVGIALLTFLVPLYGTHGRLVDEKQRLEVAQDIRLQGLVTEINQLIDSRRLGEVEPLNKALGAVIQQRDLVSKLSTWPWSSGTARALGTAILLPVLLFVIQRLAAAGLGLG